jgi:hypothetical protein
MGGEKNQMDPINPASLSPQALAYMVARMPTSVFDNQCSALAGPTDCIRGLWTFANRLPPSILRGP